jgi:hypothetical protein
MQGVLFPIADLLVRQEIPGGHAAPPFRYFAFGGGSSKRDELLRACDALLPSFPSLGGDDSVRRVISLLPSV